MSIQWTVLSENFKVHGKVHFLNFHGLKFRLYK